MHKFKRWGYVSIEVIIAAAVILGVGLIGVTSMGITGTKAMSDSLAKLDVLGIFGEGGGADPEGLYDRNGYDKTLNIQDSDINPVSDFVFALNPSGDDYTVVQYINTEDTSPVIPKSYNNKPVVAIGDDALYIAIDQNGGDGAVLMTKDESPSLLSSTRLTDTSPLMLSTFSGTRGKLVSVAIPNTIISIGDRAFANNALASVIIPNSVTTIGEDSFSGNLIAQVKLPNSITEIGERAFCNNKLTSIVIPESVLSIASSAFRTNLLTEIVFLGEKPLVLGSNVFTENVTLPDSSVVVPEAYLTDYVNSRATFDLALSKFANVDASLEDGLRYQWNATLSGWEVYEYVDKTDKSIVIPNVRNGNEPVVSVAANTFKDSEITSLVLSNNLKNIGVSAFQNNALTSVVIPNTVTIMGNDAFRNNLLTNVVFSGDKPVTLGTNIFTSNPGLTAGTVWTTAPSLAAYQAVASSRFGVISSAFILNPNIAMIEGDLKYQWNTYYNGWEVLQYLGSTNKAVVIPSSRADGYPVVSVASGVFKDMGITSISLPQGLNFIGADSFRNNNLTSLVIPDNVIKIGSRAFHTNQLTDVTFLGAKPASDGGTGGWLASNLTIPAGGVKVPAQHYLSYLGQYTSLGINAAALVINPADPNIEGDFAYRWVSTLSGWEVVQYRNTSNKTVTIPATRNDSTPVVSVGQSVFKSVGLTSVTLSTNLKTIDRWAFLNNLLTTVSIPNGVTSINNDAFSLNKLTSVALPDSLEYLGTHAFANNKLTSIVFPNNLKVIDHSSLQDNLLTSVIIPNSVTTIGEYAFGQNAIKSVSIGSGVVSIGEWAFGGNSLTAVVIPNNVTSVGAHAFSSNNYIASVTLSSNMTEISDGLFENNRITSIIIPNGVTTIGANAFSGNRLDSVVIPNSITDIGAMAFYSNELREVIIPTNVTSIGKSAFHNNWQLNKVTFLGEKPTSLGKNIFSGCSNIGLGLFKVPNVHLADYRNSATEFDVDSSKMAGQ